jgi:hypothetical protein
MQLQHRTRVEHDDYNKQRFALAQCETRFGTSTIWLSKQSESAGKPFCKLKAGSGPADDNEGLGMTFPWRSCISIKDCRMNGVQAKKIWAASAFALAARGFIDKDGVIAHRRWRRVDRAIRRVAAPVAISARRSC